MSPKRVAARRLSNLITTHSLAAFILVALGTYTVTLNGPVVVSLIASSASSIEGAPTSISFIPHGDRTLEPGEVIEIDVSITTRTPINVVGATITYPRDSLEIVGISKKDSFLDLWTEDTVIHEESGEVHFSGGTTRRGGLTGTGVILTLSVRSKKGGDAMLSAKDIQVFASDGKGAAVDTDVRTLTMSSPTSTPESDSPLSSPPGLASTLPSADLNGDGSISITDMSILAVKMISPYDARYDLNGDGKVNIGDLSTLFAKMSGR